MTLGNKCLANDIVMRYCFAGSGFGCLEHKNFKAPMIQAIEEFLGGVMAIVRFPRTMNTLTKILKQLPAGIQQRMVPALGAVTFQQKVCRTMKIVLAYG